MKILDRGCIFDAEAAPPAHRTACFTTLNRLASGAIVAAFQLGKAKNDPEANCVLMESRDDGRTWQMLCDEFQSVFDGKAGGVCCAGVIEAGPPALTAFLTWIDYSQSDKPLYDAESDSIRPSRLLFIQSQDGGRTWHDYQTLDTGPFQGCTGTLPTVRLGDGTWLLPFESYSPQPGATAVHSACALATRDGRAAGPPFTVAVHPEHKLYYWDQRLAWSPHHGRPVALFWVYDRTTEQDLPIHIAWGDATGRNWETPRSTGIIGQIAAPIPLPDGRLLAFYVERDHPGSLRLIASEDEGTTWDAEGEIIIYEKPPAANQPKQGESDYAQYWEDMGKWSFGHPAGVALDDGTVLLIHYAGDTVECLSAHWVRVQA